VPLEAARRDRWLADAVAACGRLLARELQAPLGRAPARGA
jgi:hypothetical protein